jgi:hypothetical protein
LFDFCSVPPLKFRGGCSSKPVGSGAVKVFSLSVPSKNEVKKESSFRRSSFFR